MNDVFGNAYYSLLVFSEDDRKQLDDAGYIELAPIRQSDDEVHAFLCSAVDADAAEAYCREKDIQYVLIRTFYY